MGFITREGTAPIEDGDDCLGSEVEAELAKIFAEVNGGLDTSNLAAAAGILGTQLADDTVTNSKITTSTITTAQMAASAVPKHGSETADNSGSLTTSSSLTNVDGLSGVTLTPGSTDDVILLSLTVSIVHSGSSEYHFGFNISDGTGDVTVGVASSLNSGDQTWTFQHVMNPLTTSSTVFTARYLKYSGGTGTWLSGVGLDYNTLFQVWINPSK